MVLLDNYIRRGWYETFIVIKEKKKLLTQNRSLEILVTERDVRVQGTIVL